MDEKISAMPAATDPLTGSELVPLLQGGANVQDTVANLTAGRAVAGLSFTGNSFQVTSSCILTESTTSRTLSATDNGKIIYCTAATAVTITTAVSLGAGFSCVIIQGGAGQVGISAAASTTVVSYGSLTHTAGQYAMVTVICPVANTFYLGGSMA